MRVIVRNYTRFVRPALLLLVSMLLSAADLTIDHVTAAGIDLNTMRTNLAAVGIASEYGGPHSNHATEMALTSFPDGSYLELIAIQPNADAAAVTAHYWSKPMKNDAGPTAWAVRPKDFDFETKRLQARHLTVQPARSGRARPDGVRLEWEAAPVGTGPNGVFFPFLIRDFTPREQRADPSGKPTTDDFSGVSRVVILVRDLKAAISRYRQVYDLPAPSRQTDERWGAALAGFPGTPVVLASPMNDRSWLAARLKLIGEGPIAFVLKAANGKTHSAATTATWFGSTISWFDTQKLGWWLGFE
jgi:Glyoxalase-like domain